MDGGYNLEVTGYLAASSIDFRVHISFLFYINMEDFTNFRIEMRYQTLEARPLTCHRPVCKVDRHEVEPKPMS